MSLSTEMNLPEYSGKREFFFGNAGSRSLIRPEYKFNRNQQSAFSGTDRPLSAEIYSLSSEIDTYNRDNEQFHQIWKRDTSSFPATHSTLLTSSEINSLNEAITGRFNFIKIAYFPELYESLNDLQGAENEAYEEGFQTPSNLALSNAERLIKEMYALSSRRYEIYPTPDREIAIDAPGGFGRSVLLLCDSDGGALCLVNINGRHRRARYSSTELLPDGFLREALAELEQGKG